MMMHFAVFVLAAVSQAEEKSFLAKGTDGEVKGEGHSHRSAAATHSTMAPTSLANEPSSSMLFTQPGQGAPTEAAAGQAVVAEKAAIEAATKADENLRLAKLAKTKADAAAVEAAAAKVAADDAAKAKTAADAAATAAANAASAATRARAAIL